MELLIGIIVFAIVAWFAVTLFAGLGAVAVVGKDAKRSEAAEANSKELLDELFDGRANVSYRLAGGMKEETVLNGAAERGYTLVSTTSNKYGGTEALYFAKR